MPQIGRSAVLEADAEADPDGYVVAPRHVTFLSDECFRVLASFSDKLIAIPGTSQMPTRM